MGMRDDVEREGDAQPVLVSWPSLTNTSFQDEDEPQRNVALAYRALDYIKAHPEDWDQGVWECGTTACFAGWVIRLSGPPVPKPFDHAELASRLLGFADWDDLQYCLELEANAPLELFGANNTLEDLESAVRILFGPRPVSA